MRDYVCASKYFCRGRWIDASGCHLTKTNPHNVKIFQRILALSCLQTSQYFIFLVIDNRSIV